MQMVPTEHVSGQYVPAAFADLARATALHLLIIDDVEADARLTIEMLELADHRTFAVEVASSMTEARNALARRTFSVALLDLGLPDVEGVEGVHELGQMAPEMPIVVVSGNTDDAVALLAIEHGAQDYLVKGRFDSHHLVHALRYAIERSKLMRRLDASQERLQTVVDHTADGIVVVSQKRRVLFANERASPLLTGGGALRVGSELDVDIAPGEPIEIAVPLGGGADAEPRFVELSVDEIEWNGELAFLVSIHDSTKTKRLTQALASSNRKLRQVALMDPLTDLYNRRGFHRALEAELSGAQRGGYGVAALVVDCDEFKRINDVFGHAVGDTVLRHVAGRLRATCRRHDVVARIGGDEFLILLPRADLAVATSIAERIRLAICSRPLPANGSEVTVTVSVGVIMLDAHTSTVGEVLAASHLSLKKCKSEGKNRVACGGHCTPVKRLDTWLNENDIDRGLSVVWQPIVRVRDETIVGHELLIRGPAGIAERPADLFRLAREQGFLVEVDVACLVACLRAASRMGARGRLHVNIFPSLLLAVQITRLVELFGRLHLDRETSLCLEINEDELIEDWEKLRERIQILRSKGVRVALDDVGSGTGSIDTVIALELDQVKIDGCLVTGASRDQAQGAHLGRTVRSMKALGNEVIAEGVEERADLTFLRQLGVEYAQGFLWSAPVNAPVAPPEMFASRVADERTLRSPP